MVWRASWLLSKALWNKTKRMKGKNKGNGEVKMRRGAGRVAQLVEQLPSKYEAPSSGPSATKHNTK
jgi:hypothetical protein